MSRITKYIVYVDKEVMTKPAELADAVLAHFIKKELDIKKRKQFLALFMKAARVSDEHALKMINAWVQVRDVVGFPFRKEQDEDTSVEGGVPMDDGADEEPESGVASE